MTNASASQGSVGDDKIADPPPGLVAVDASIYIFRAFFSLPDNWHAEDGMPTNALLGLLRTVLDLWDQRNASHWLVAFDESLTTCFRNRLLPAYKAQRPEPDAEIVAQLRTCREAVTLMGLATCADLEYEADDYIASATTAFRQRHPATSAVPDAGPGMWLATRDKDIGQLLVDESSYLWDVTSKDRVQAITSRADFIARWGVTPEQFVDFQALTGDTVDNVPGVTGIGNVTAAKLLQRFTDLENLYERLDELAADPAGIRGAQRVLNGLSAAQEQVFAMREIVRLRTDVLPFADVDALKPVAPDGEALMTLLEWAGLSRSLGARMGSWLEARAGA